MPAPSNSSAAHQWRDSWPPAQVHLQQPVHAAASESDPVTIAHKDPGHGTEMDLADENPLVHFLTPAPLLAPDDDDDSYIVDDSEDSSSNYYDEDSSGSNGGDDYSYGYGFGYSSGMDFELDAGIEDDTHPQPIIRSVSPSALAESIHGNGNGVGGCLSRTVRPPTPPRTSTSSLLGGDACDNDDDEESFVRYGDAGHSNTFGRILPVNIMNNGSNGSRRAVTRKGKVSSMRQRHQQQYLSASPLSSPPSLSSSLQPGFWIGSNDAHNCANLHSNNNTTAIDDTGAGSDWNRHFQHHYQGRSAGASASALCAGAGAMIPRRRSPRSWRVPSPDVFSIQEETEEELGGSAAARQPATSEEHYGGAFLEVQAAKPKKKRVRFVLPHEEIV